MKRITLLSSIGGGDAGSSCSYGLFLLQIVFLFLMKHEIVLASRSTMQPIVRARRVKPWGTQNVAKSLLWLQKDHEQDLMSNRLLANVLVDLRGGAAAKKGLQEEGEEEDSDEEEESEEEEEQEPNNKKDDDEEEEKETTPKEALSKEPVPITVQTSLGHALVDQIFELNVQRSRTVASLKESLRRQLPGKPPVASMQLVVDGKVLEDDIIVQDLLDDEDDEEEDEEEEQDDVDKSSLLTITLDMIPPVDPKFMTHVEEQLSDMTTAELLQAFAVNEAALLKNAVLLERECHSSTDNASSSSSEHSVMEIDDEIDDDDESAAASALSRSNILYLELRQDAERIRRDMEQTILASESARRLLADDVPPAQKKAAIEVRGQRVKVPRTGGRTTMIKEHIQRNLNVQWADTIRYCVLFLFFGYFGGRTPASRAILLLGAPSVFVLQARPVKLWIKQVLYTLLDHPPGILLSLLPAPQQAMLNLDYDASMQLLYSTFSEETKSASAQKDQNNDEETEEDSEDEDDYDSDDDDYDD